MKKIILNSIIIYLKDSPWISVNTHFICFYYEIIELSSVRKRERTSLTWSIDASSLVTLRRNNVMNLFAASPTSMLLLFNHSTSIPLCLYLPARKLLLAVAPSLARLLIILFILMVLLNYLFESLLLLHTTSTSMLLLLSRLTLMMLLATLPTSIYFCFLIHMHEHHLSLH